MALTNKQKEKISIEVIKTLVLRFNSFPIDTTNNRNAPFHSAFLKAFSDKLHGKVPDIPFFISLSSWLHGLNTTLGQSFFESVAHHLCCGERREYTAGRLGTLQITRKQRENITEIMTNLSNGIHTPNLVEENKIIFYDAKEKNLELVDSLGFSVDVFIEEDNEIIAIELKSVRPNSGEMRGEKHKILEGKAALSRKFPNKNIKFFIGFPFDPTIEPYSDSEITNFDKDRFFGTLIKFKRYFSDDETLVACELWDELSGEQGTMDSILNIINIIATPSFLSEFQFIRDTTKRETTDYEKLVTKWNLFSELELIKNNSQLLTNIIDNRTLMRMYNINSFDMRGNYNFDRFNELKVFLDIKN